MRGPNALTGDAEPGVKMVMTFPRDLAEHPRGRCTTRERAAGRSTARACSSGTAGTTATTSIRCSRSASGSGTRRSPSSRSGRASGDPSAAVAAAGNVHQHRVDGPAARSCRCTSYCCMMTWRARSATLAAFRRVRLEPGETERVDIQAPPLIVPAPASWRAGSRRRVRISSWLVVRRGRSWPPAPSRWVDGRAAVARSLPKTMRRSTAPSGTRTHLTGSPGAQAQLALRADVGDVGRLVPRVSPRRLDWSGTRSSSGCGTAYVSAWMARRGARVWSASTTRRASGPGAAASPPSTVSRADARPRRRRGGPVPRRLVRLRDLGVRRGDRCDPYAGTPRLTGCCGRVARVALAWGTGPWRCLGSPIDCSLP